MKLDEFKEFPVTIFGELEKYNEVISKGRVRIFYKGFNRNGTYITDDFAEKLLQTLPYAPIKGIYDEDDGDFTDHGDARTEGRAYGVVPNEPNITWEAHVDEDGVERTYACADVLLWTGIYEEAKEIIGKGQSMELYEPSIRGEFKIIEGRRVFEYSDACFLGLQALGDMAEPCFEGSAFFTLYSSLKQMIQKIDNFTLNSETGLNEGGQPKMPAITFKLSDSEKHEAIFNLLNPDFNEEKGWVIEYAICDIYDEYALCYNYELNQYERVTYTKDDAADSVSIGEKTKVYILDITEEEKTALDSLRAQNGDTYEKVDEKFGTIATLEEEKAQSEQKIGELNTTISTLTTERDSKISELEAANATVTTLNSELEGLKEYKLQVETTDKEAVISSYSTLLDNAIIDAYTLKIADFTKEELEKELAFELVKSNPTMFTKDPQYVPKDTTPSEGLTGLLSKYKK